MKLEYPIETSGTLLVVEDDVILAKTVAKLLGDNGYAVTLSHDGAEGLEIAKKALSGIRNVK
ncbi:MAG: hypothetical protein O3C21_10405 [Verrucomicrobia bacterium]|nr:hypothetical protein [Verrucomicrobiota bacterium]